MKVTVVTEDYYSNVSNMFKGHEVSLLDKSMRTWGRNSADIMVFTGGADVNPEYYGVTRPPRGGWFDFSRDEFEFEALNYFRAGRLPSKKILGICRGMQIINVHLGGSLHYDIPTTFGTYHPGIHDLSWMMESPLKELFPTVNSLHHQGLNRVGDSYATPRILAVEPATLVPEVVTWGDIFLGVQFHPEFMQENPSVPKFVKILEEWVEGKITLFESPATKPVIKKPTKTVSQSLETFNFNSGWYTTTQDSSES